MKKVLKLPWQKRNGFFFFHDYTNFGIDKWLGLQKCLPHLINIV